MTSSPFATPGTASGISWEDLNGALLLIEPLSLEHGVRTEYGEKDAIRANVAILDGSQAGEDYPDCLVFPLVLQGQLRSRLGAKVLGRLEQGLAKKGQKPPWKLAEATEADVAIGTAYLAGGISQPGTDTPPF